MLQWRMAFPRLKSRRRAPKRLKIQFIQISPRLAPALWLCCAVCFGASRAATQPEESPAVTSIKASFDGRYVATRGSTGELTILGIPAPGSRIIVTRHLADGFAWAPDSNALVFAERPPGSPTRLWLVRPESGRDPAPLAGGFDWKGSPGWRDFHRVAYLSDRDSDHVNLWEVDTSSGLSRKILDRQTDITGLWVLSDEPALIFRSAESGSPELWLWRSGEEAVQVSRDRGGEVLVEDNVVFSPEGGSIAYLASRAGRTDVVHHDIARGEILSTLRLDSRPEDLAFASSHEILITMGSRIYRWDFSNPTEEFSPEAMDWEGLGLSHPVRLNETSWAAVANGNLILTADEFNGWDRAKIHARRVQDLIYLSARWQSAGRSREARGMLEKLWNSDASTAGFTLATTRAWVERMRGKPRSADPWLIEALEFNDAPRTAIEEVWRERLFIHLFDRGSSRGARKILEEMPEEFRKEKAARWVGDLLEDGNRRGLGRWRRIVKALRRKQWADCASGILKAAAADQIEEIDRRGLALLLRGAFEPTAQTATNRPLSNAQLFNEPQFQEALLLLSNQDLTPDLPKDDLRALLMFQWAKGRQLDAAGSLVLADLRDPSGSSLDYLDILERYLDPEEHESWMERAVAEMLLGPRVSGLLDRHMSDTRAHLVFGLARAKQALIAGDIDRVGEILDQLERDHAIISPVFWDATTGKLLLLLRLFRTKYHERSEAWESARAGYEQCREVIGRYPGQWGILPFDLSWAQSILAEAGADVQELREFLQLLRGIGDPLINPAHEHETIEAGLAGLRTLKSIGVDARLQAFLEFTEGLLYSLLEEPVPALAALQRSRARRPSPALLTRILLEEAAVRSAMGQYRLAADLLARIARTELDAPSLALAISVQAQAEKEAGLIESQEDRIRFLCRELRLPRRWCATLIPDETILPLEEELRAAVK